VHEEFNFGNRVLSRLVPMDLPPEIAYRGPHSLSLLEGTIKGQPLSDDNHLLSIDALSRLLCLRLPYLRLFFLVPPDSLSRDQQYEDDPKRRWGRRPPLPSVYASIKDLTRTIRIAAAYDDVIVLYSIPGDAFRASPNWPMTEDRNEHWTSWWNEVGMGLWNVPVTRPECLPYLLRGVIVGRLEGVQALSIHAFGDVSGKGGLVVWAFARDRRVVAWSFDGKRKSCPPDTADRRRRKPVMYKAQAHVLRRL